MKGNVREKVKLIFVCLRQNLCVQSFLNIQNGCSEKGFTSRVLLITTIAPAKNLHNRLGKGHNGNGPCYAFL